MHVLDDHLILSGSGGIVAVSARVFGPPESKMPDTVRIDMGRPVDEDARAELANGVERFAQRTGALGTPFSVRPETKRTFFQAPRLESDERDYAYSLGLGRHSWVVVRKVGGHWVIRRVYGSIAPMTRFRDGRPHRVAHGPSTKGRGGLRTKARSLTLGPQLPATL